MVFGINLENLPNGFLIISSLSEVNAKNETFVEYREFPQGGYYIQRRDKIISFRTHNDIDHGPQAYAGKTENYAIKKAREVANMIISDAGFDRYRDLTYGNDRDVLIAENLPEDNGKGIFRS